MTKKFALFILLVLAGVYFIFDPSQYPFPPCPLRWLTGLKCPGCGSQRAAHALLHGHIGQAWRLNPLLVVSIPYVVWGMVLEYTPWGREMAKFWQRLYGYRAAMVAFVVIVVFGVLRNVWGF